MKNIPENKLGENFRKQVKIILWTTNLKASNFIFHSVELDISNEANNNMRGNISDYG